jgi:hypothetical protein
MDPRDKREDDEETEFGRGLVSGAGIDLGGR